MCVLYNSTDLCPSVFVLSVDCMGHLDNGICLKCEQRGSGNHLPTSRTVYLSICLSFCLTADGYVCLSLCLHTCLSFWMIVFVFVCLCVSAQAHAHVCLYFCVLNDRNYLPMKATWFFRTNLNLFRKNINCTSNAHSRYHVKWIEFLTNGYEMTLIVRYIASCKFIRWRPMRVDRMW